MTALIRGVPIFPPRNTFMPALVNSFSVSIAVVVFPLVPVIAIIGLSRNFDANSISLIIFIFFFIAIFKFLFLRPIPGLTTI